MLADGYRPALDGVRAFAVLAVIAYHLGLPVEGGYLGVDVFFVLSGYLITRLLLEERARRGRIDLVDFWARRARRLLPALVPVVLLCAAMAARGPLLDLEVRRADILATLVYYANWHFIDTDQSYFASYNGASPLRHMWSLAIEEQFYVLWPLLLAGAAWALRSRRAPLVVLVGLAAAASVWRMSDLYDVTDPSRAYFGTDTRAFQLLIGAALAVVLVHWRGRLTGRVLGRVMRLSVPALVFVVGVCVALLPEASPMYFQGGALVFSLGVAGLLLALELGAAQLLQRVLSAQPMVLVGQVSYGLYLWHWPLLVLAEGSAVLEGWSSWLRAVLVLVLTFAAAGVSYAVVERPVRRGRAVWVRSSPARLALAAPVVLALTGLLTIVVTTDGATALARQVSDTSVTACPAGTTSGWCARTVAAAGQPTVAVIGDSTGLALDPGMTALAEQEGWGYVQGGRNGCSVAPVPVQAGEASATPIAEACAAAAVPLLESIEAGAHPDIWVISDRLLLAPLHRGGRFFPIGTEEHAQAVVGALSDTLDMLTTWGTVVLLETPPRGEPVDCALGDAATQTCENPVFTTADSETRLLAGLFRSAVAETEGQVALIRVSDLLCDQETGRCPAADGDRLIRYDGVHYTAGFSRELVPRLVERMQTQGVPLRR